MWGGRIQCRLKVGLRELWGIIKYSTDFPRGSVIKNPLAKQETRFSLWVGKIPWRRKWQPTSLFLPGKSSGESGLGFPGLQFMESQKTSTRLGDQATKNKNNSNNLYLGA